MYIKEMSKMHKNAETSRDCTGRRPGGLYTVRRSQNHTALDLCFVRPNHDKYIPPAVLHTIAHLGDRFLRNHPKWRSRTIYFGPMACRTGFCLILSGWHSANGKETLVYKTIVELMKYIMDFEGEIPDATEKECSNYKEHDLLGAKEWAGKYLHALKKPHFEYSKIKTRGVSG